MRFIFQTTWIILFVDVANTHALEKHNSREKCLYASTLSTNSKRGDLIEGSKSTLDSVRSYWSNIFTAPSRAIQSILPVYKSKLDKEQEELSKIVITSVKAPNSRILPDQVLQIAAKKARLLGGTINSQSVDECARIVKQWYERKGYVLHAITGAKLIPKDREVCLSVQEPVVSSQPVSITFAKEMVLDDELGNKPMTFRQYRKKYEKKNKHRRNIAKDLNTTFVTTTGRTNPRAIAKALKLEAGKPFQWNEATWERIVGSGIFKRILRVTPERMNDGTAQLQVICQEPQPRNLEYGISKSLYTGSFEGELDFRHENLLGGGEKLGVSVSRGTKDPEPSVRIKYSDNKLGLNGGFNINVFNDYIAVNDSTESKIRNDEVEEDEDKADTMSDNIGVSSSSIHEDDKTTTGIAGNSICNEDTILCRKGTTVQFRNPLSTEIIEDSSLSISLERTSTRTGKHEFVGSTTLELTPMAKTLPLGGRTNFLTKTTIGTKLGSGLLPYSSATVITRQIFPLRSSDDFTESGELRQTAALAFEHSVMSSTRNLPRHEANAAGFAARVRGYSRSSSEPICSYVVGTTEFRIPIKLPSKKCVQDGSIVLFGDWKIAASRNIQSDTGVRGGINKTTFYESSFGIGFRKKFQGIPLKYDVSLTQDKKLGAFFGLGGDFDV